MATVFGIIVFPDRAPFFGRVGFIPLVPIPSGHGSDSLAWGPVSATCNSIGFFTKELAAGTYWVHVGNALRRLIVVPDEAKIYLLQDLLGGTATGISPQNFRHSADGIQFIHGITGLWHSFSITGSPDAPDLLVSPAGEILPTPSFRIEGTTAFFRDFTAGAWHAPFLSGPDDAPLLEFGAIDAAIPGGNFRETATRWQLRNVTTGRFHTLFVTGDPGAQAWALGAGE